MRKNTERTEVWKGRGPQILKSIHNYYNIREVLSVLWEEVKEKKDAKSIMNKWSSAFSALYGYKPDISLFLKHVYLCILAKIAVYIRLENTFKENISSIIDNEYWAERGITNFTDEDVSLWLANPKIEEKSRRLFMRICEKMTKYDFSSLNEDIFAGIYEEIVSSKERHKTGEYCTPRWLVELILKEVFSLWEERERCALPKIIDPACGTGTFIFHIVKNLAERYGLNDILSSVAAIDINPVATMLAKANYLLAISDLLTHSRGKITIPIYTKDSLRDNFGQRAEKHDIVIGNPPWIVMRSIKNNEYQNFLKKEVLKYHLLKHKDVHLFTQMEIATIFFCKCADLYLKKGGIIAFIMPRSVLFGTIHHANFRKFERPPVKLVKIIDLEGVKPLFNMPSCVLIGVKGETTEYPVLMDAYKGELLSENVGYLEAKKELILERCEYTPPNFSSQPSYYFHKFKVGASIFPRSLYFVDIISKGSLIKVKTSSDIYNMVKEPWKVMLNGEVEERFLYATLLAWEIIPFSYIKLRPVLLPIEPQSGKYRLLNVEELFKRGFFGVAEWFKHAEKIWREKRTERSKKRFPSILDRLNYNGLLTIQNSSKRYVVLYNATGTHPTSCVIDRKFLASFEVNSEKIKPKGFVADVKTWFFETDGEMEAYYLCAVFNSGIISEMIKPLQPRGLFGERAIHRRPLLFAIPRFESTNSLHVELAKIGKSAHEKVKTMKFRQRNNIRAEVRRRLQNEIEKINEIVGIIMGAV